MKKFYLVISFTFLLISCNEFNTLNKKNISKTKSNINLDKTINLNKGIYYCKKCNSKLYSSTNKLDSNDNNESFYKSIEDNVDTLLREHEAKIRTLIDAADVRFESQRDRLRTSQDAEMKELEARLTKKLQRALDNPLAN